MRRNIAKIFEINIISTRKERVLSFVRSRLGDKREKRPFLIFTPNPEIVSLALIDKNFTKVLNLADLTLPDGIGLVQAKKFLDLPSPDNKILRIFVLLGQGLLVGAATFLKKDWLFDSLYPIKGREMFMELMKLANKKNWKVFLLGGKGTVGEEASDFLRKTLKRVDIFHFPGPVLDLKADPVSKEEKLAEKEAIERINRVKPHLLFVGFGAPKQELWLSKWLSKLEVGGAMTVGGTFDFLAGRAKLPPFWMENIGLEWVWRLVRQPLRLKRIIRAFPLFPLKIFWYKLTK